MKRLLLSFATLLAGASISLAQCPQGVAYATNTAPAPGGSTTITTCNFAGEYNTVNGVVAGNDYTVTGTGGAGNYFTVYDNTLTAVAWGLSPLSFTAATSGTFYTQVNLDAACGTDGACHTVVWQNTTPPPPCPAEIAPWTEPFAGTTNPACWTQSTTTGGPWVYTGTPGYDVSGTPDNTPGGGTNFAWIDFSGTDAGVILTTPEIDITALSVPELVFWEVSHYTGALTPYNFLYVEAWDGATWQQVDVIQGETGPAWVEYTYILTPWIYNTNFVQVRFRAESGGSSSDFYNDLLLDDVGVREAPTCPAPIGLTLDSADLTSASFSWTPQGTETEWFIEWGTPGFTPGTGAGTVSSPISPSPNGTVSGLPTDSFYEAYVLAACGPGDSSFYVGPISFNTYNQPLYMGWDSECGPGFIDISGTGTATNFTDDAELGLTLPFTLLFQGTLASDITIAENGVVVLGNSAANIGFGNQTIAAAPENGIYAFWDDLDVDWGDVYYETIGTAPNQTFIVQYQDKNYWNGPAGEVITFQVQIEEATGEFYVVYPDTEFGGSDSFYDNGSSATIGLAGPNQDLPVSYNNANYLANNSCVHYYYTDCPKPSDFVVNYTTADEAGISWTAGLANETNWTVIYGLDGFDPTTGGTTVNVGTSSTILFGLDDITCYDVYIYADCNPGVLQSLAYMGEFCTLPNCANPSGITASSAPDSLLSAWSWTGNAGFPSTGFGIEYGMTGFTPGAGTTAWLDNNYTDTTEDLSLIGGGLYDIYIQAVCGVDSSAWIGPVTVTMPLTNDSTCFAEELMVDGSEYVLSNAGATTDIGENTIAPPATGCQTQDGWCNSNLNFTTWFTFTAPASGNVNIDCGGTNFDGQVAIYEVTDCADFATYTFLGGNDDFGGLSPNLTVCGLTAGSTYYVMFDSYSTFSTGVYSMILNDVVVEAGSDLGLVNVCLGDSVDLFDQISGYDLGGTWLQDTPTLGLNGSMFNTDGLASQVFGFQYVVQQSCATDTVATTVEVYAPSSAGTDGTITACMNEPINLLTGLSGNVDLGGTWYDTQNQPSSSSISAASIPGQFNYDYIVSNGVCPADTANVVVTVDGTCDYLNIEEMVFGNMNMYPNPTNGSVFITNNGSAEVFDYELTDVNGKVIIAQVAAINGTETTEVDMENLNPGFYLIRVFNDNADKTFRIIKE